MNDFIGNAFDRAVDKLADVVGIPEETAAPEPTKEVTEPATQEAAPEAPQETKEIQKALEKKEPEYKSPKEERREKAFGKAAPKVAAPKPVSDQSANLDPAAAQTAQKVDVQPSEIPQFWSAKMRAAAESTSDKALVKAMIEHDAQREETIRRAHSEAQSSKALIEKLNADFETPEELQKHRAERAFVGIKDDADELHRYRAWDKLLKNDVPTALVDLMRKNNLTPEHLSGLFYGNAQAPTPQQQFDPEEARRIASETAQSEFQKFQQESMQKAVQSDIAQFLNEKDSYGNVRMPFFQMHRQVVEDAAKVIEKDYPNLSPREVVHHAYEYAITEARKAYGITAQPAQTKAVADPVKARNASGSVSGSPSLGVAPQRSRFKSEKFADKIEEAYSRAEARLGAR